jgi:tripartite-type tricarboxylate transporter receptor subunit TctC
VKLPHRRRFLHLAAAALPVVPRVAGAQAYPARPVRIIVPVAAGGLNDVTPAPGRPMAVGAPRPTVLRYFKPMTGTDLTHVPYRGEAPAVADLLGGQIQVAFTEMATSLGDIKAGRLRALAVTTAARSQALPEVRTLSEFIADFEASQWVGLVAPKDMSSAIIEKLNNEINASLGDAGGKARFANLGGTVLPGSPAGFGKLIRDEPRNGPG